MFPASTQRPQNVVESARQAREERALNRKREAALLSIQALARGFISRRRVYHEWIEEIDEIIGYEKSKEQPTKKTSSNTCNEKSSKPILPSYSTKDKASDAPLPANWGFQSFSSTKLTGTYSKLSIKPTPENDNEALNAVVSSKSPETSAPSAESKINEAKSPSSPNAEKTSLPSPPKFINGVDLFNVAKKLLFLMNLQRDKWRYEKLCRQILENCNSEKNVKVSYCSLCVSKQYAVAWIQQVKQLLRTCCDYLKILNPHEHHSSRMINICLNMMVLFTDPSSWALVKRQPALSAILSQMMNSVSLDLYVNGSLRSLGTLLHKRASSSHPLNDDPMILAAFTMTLRPLIAGGMKHEFLTSFTKYVLSVPALLWHVNKISSQVMVVMSKNLLFPKLLSTLRGENRCKSHGLFQSRHASSSTVIDILCTIANLAQLAVIEKETLEQNHMNFVNVMNQLLNYLVDHTCHQKSALTTWHPVLGFYKSSETTQNQPMKYVKIQLEYFWNPSLLKAVFCDVLNLKSLHSEDATPTQAEQLVAKSAKAVKLSDRVSSYLKKFTASKPRAAIKQTGGRKLEYKEVKNTTSTCLMFRKLLSIVTKQLQLEMLTGLTFMDQVLSRLWRFICELGTSGGLKLFLSALTLRPEVAEPYFAVFTLFCDMTAHILSILDDIEFYEEQIPFHLEELVTISESLRKFVFRIIWDQKMTDSNHHIQSVFESSLTLLLMLHDRDARRPFTPVDHWICRDVKPSTIRSEIEKSSSRGMKIIEKIPFVIPHKDRVVLFRSLVTADKNVMEDSDPIHITVKRSRLLEDGFEQLSSMQTRDLKGTIRVKFINDLGLDEAGIDQDGVFKEFLEEIIKKVFNPDMNLFRVTTEEDGKLYPSPTSYLQDDHLKLLNFVGKLLAKAVYEGIVVDVPFATFFLRHLQQQHSMLYSPLDELPSLDAEFYKNLTWIKRYDGDMSDLDLTFTYEEDVLGRLETRELEPGGSSIPVTNQNKFTYIHKLAHYRLHTQIKDQTRAFIAGFRSIIDKRWTSMFSARELQRLISGDNVDLDLSDLKRNTTYYGGFHSSHRVVKWLWDVLEKDYSPQQRAAFLKFVTSCSRPPILGFTYLQPPFSIRCVEVSDDDDTGDSIGTVFRGFFRISSRRQGNQNLRLPTASTCFNLLKLPNYPSKDILRDKLKQAIANNTGFELS